MFYTIYKITNKIDGKEYIGKHMTVDLNDNYMGSGKLIKRAITKHGIENFVKEILYIFDNEENMNIKEKELVTEEYCDREDTYNLCSGGQGGFGYISKNRLNGGIVSQNSRSNLGNNKGNPSLFVDWMKTLSKEEYKEWKDNSISAMKKKYPNGIWKDRNHKPETIEQMKISAIGKQEGEKNSQFGTCWITDGSKNKKIKKEELDFWTEQGYYKGRVLG